MMTYPVSLRTTIPALQPKGGQRLVNIRITGTVAVRVCKETKGRTLRILRHQSCVDVGLLSEGTM